MSFLIAKCWKRSEGLSGQFTDLFRELGFLLQDAIRSKASRVPRRATSEFAEFMLSQAISRAESPCIVSAKLLEDTWSYLERSSVPVSLSFQGLEDSPEFLQKLLSDFPNI